MTGRWCVLYISNKFTRFTYSLSSSTVLLKVGGRINTPGREFMKEAAMDTQYAVCLIRVFVCDAAPDVRWVGE